MTLEVEAKKLWCPQSTIAVAEATIGGVTGSPQGSFNRMALTDGRTATVPAGNCLGRLCSWWVDTTPEAAPGTPLNLSAGECAKLTTAKALAFLADRKPS